ncbi:MAG: TIM barrel protein, partial [Chitinophagaceae bacterium]
MALNIQYGVSTWLWTSPFDVAAIDVLLPKISDMGFDVVEIAVEDPALIDVSKIKKALAANGLKAVVCGAFGPNRDLTSDDASLQKNSLEYIESCLDICAGLETDFFGGPMYSAVGKARMLPQDLRKKEWELAVENLHKVS